MNTTEFLVDKIAKPWTPFYLTRELWSEHTARLVKEFPCFMPVEDLDLAVTIVLDEMGMETVAGATWQYLPRVSDMRSGDMYFAYAGDFQKFKEIYGYLSVEKRA